MYYLTADDERGLLSSLPEKLKVGSKARAESSGSMMSPVVYDDHDYVCCRGSKVVNFSEDQNRRASAVQPEIDGPQSKTASRDVNAVWKVGHDARRKLCIVGFNWNSSQLRLNKLGAAGKSGTSSSVGGDGRGKPKRTKMVMTSTESTSVVETTTQAVSGGSGDRPEVVKSMEQQPHSSLKRRSKVYIYKPATSTTDCSAARSTTAKPIALVNKSKGKTGNRNTSMSAEDETSAAVESIIPSTDLYTTLGGSQKRTGEYTIQLSSTGPSKPSAKKVSPDYGYLTSLLRETGSGISPDCDVMSAAALSLQQIIEGGVQTSSSSAASSTAALGIPSPFLLQTGLEQALGFAAFHPMSPSTSSSSCSRVAGDDWPVNDDDDPNAPQTARLDPDGVSRSTMLAPDSWIGGSTYMRCSGHHHEPACGSGDAVDHASLPSSHPEPVFFDDLSTPSNDGDLRYESSSFVVCEDSWDGYQREEQIDDCWSQLSSSDFGRKSAASRFRYTDTGIITSFGGGGSSFGRAGGRSDRRRKQPEDKRTRKSLNGAEGDVVTVPESDRPEAVSASKKLCRQRTCGDGSKRAVTSTASASMQSEVTVDVDNHTSSNRRRKQPTSKKYSAAIESLSSVASDGTSKEEVALKKRAQSRSSRGQLKANSKTQTAVCCI